jgi:uncharacterized damage-inducible protein DinB
MPGNVAPVADEHGGLLAFLAHQRYVLRLSGYGLIDEQARLAPSASTLSIGGLIKHMTAMERQWMDIVLSRPIEFAPEKYQDDFRLGPEETLAEVLDHYAEAAAETEKIIAGITDLGQPVPVPRAAPWAPKDVAAWSVRWVLLHLIEETARHAGHADIVRESIDGAQAFPLMAAAENWPSSPWLQPWRPSAELAEG